MHSQNGKVVCGDERAARFVCVAVDKQVKLRDDRIGRERGKGMVVIAKRNVFGIREAGAVSYVSLGIDSDQLTSIRNAKRLEEQSIHKAEDRRIRPNANRQKQQHGQSASGSLAQNANAIAKVLQKGMHRPLRRESGCSLYSA